MLSGKSATIATFEFLCVVRSKGWLISTFGMPVFLLMYGGLISIPAFMEARAAREVAVYGVVDEAKVLGLSGEVTLKTVEIPEEIRSALDLSGQQKIVEEQIAWLNNTVFRPFASEPEAREALVAERIKGYYRLPPDYVATGLVERYANEGTETSGARSRKALEGLLAKHLLADRVPPEIAERARVPIKEAKRWTIAADGTLKTGDIMARILRLVVPLGFGVLLLISMMMTSGSLIQATATEKENKVVEVILSSAAPDQILLGKLLGVGGAGLLQIAIWFGMLGIGALAGAAALAGLGVEIPWGTVAVSAAFFVVAYLFYGSLMLGTGSLGSNQKQANQLGMIWSLLAVVPMVFSSALVMHPDGVLARILTWIPFSAPVTVIFRLAFDPNGTAWWEVVGPLLVLIASTWFAIRLGARLFRVGILLTGARPKWRDIIRQARLSA